MAKPFLQAVPVLELIEESGFEAYFVGGSVRDHILGREISDVDIATSALPDELKEIFPKTVDLGIEHGTILVHYRGESYEITTFRSEAGYTDFRRPDQVSFIRSLRDDLQRRDFTMNAIAMDKEGNILDPFSGVEAISQKKIATVGNPEERFGEDALRMLRAVRFLSQLCFSIEKRTYDSLVKQCHLLDNIAVERKTVEFEKMLKGQNRNEAIRLLASSGMHQYLPGLKNHTEPLFQFSVSLFKDLQISEAWVLLLFHLELKGKEVEEFLRSWKLPVQTIKRYKLIYSWVLERNNGQSWTVETVYKAGIDIALSAEKVFTCLHTGKDESRRIIHLYESLPIRNRQELMVSGNDIMSWLGEKPGPWLRDVLEEVERAVINGKVPNDKEKIKVWLNGLNRKSEKS
ncbi:CCA tRNA nucleotidyltransferase [Mesobacillus subterraneus]|uniref:CCA-adding enzyme n=1 Tax=Mesobacillus subterraneus TaxID=285983 RepID=A0A3R9FHJ0_9BACI|nr:CCA tRNA nucleotidyltransferase [Mesobacillus subterraneus]RSD26584.1 CCA tRNA nucleotidyltransferase [Mesobacillus subterraneus]